MTEDGYVELAERVQRLEDERAIIDCIAAYGHALDYGSHEIWEDCWADSASLEWPSRKRVYRGRDELREAFDSHTHAPEHVHKHFVVAPRISHEGDRAGVEGYYVRLDRGEKGPVFHNIGRYKDTLVRCPDGRWRFEERRTEVESRATDAA